MPVSQRKPASPNEHFPAAPEWPEGQPAPKDHNRPPVEEQVAAEFREQLLTVRPDFEARLADMLAAAARVEVIDDESLGRAGDLIKMYRAAERHIGETHKDVKAPYLAGGRAVDGEKNALIDRITPVRAKVQTKMDAYASKKAAEERAERQRIEQEQRRQAEEAARAQREADAAEERRLAAVRAGEKVDEPAPAPPPPPVAIAPVEPTKSEPVRSDAGSTVSGREVWNSKITDYTLAFIACEDNPKVREAIDKAIAAQVRAGKRKIDGCQIWPTAQAVAR